MGSEHNMAFQQTLVRCARRVMLHRIEIQGKLQHCINMTTALVWGGGGARCHEFDQFLVEGC